MVSPRLHDPVVAVSINSNDVILNLLNNIVTLDISRRPMDKQLFGGKHAEQTGFDILLLPVSLS